MSTILEEAQKLTTGDRQESYGHPFEDFSRIVGMLNALFADRLIRKFEVTDWPLIMQLVKISREYNAPKHDNRVDGAGYWNTLEILYDYMIDGGVDVLDDTSFNAPSSPEQPRSLEVLVPQDNSS